MIQPSLEEFRTYAAEADLVPVWREILFDTHTAVTAYAALARPPFGFLLESVIGGETWARYSFLGSAPAEVWKIGEGGAVARWTPAAGWGAPGDAGDPLAALDHALQSRRIAAVDGLPRFVGGAVGYLGYDIVRHIEKLESPPPDPLGLPEGVLLFTDSMLAIDNLFGRAFAIALVDVRGAGPDEIAGRYARGAATVEQMIADLAVPASLEPLPWDPAAAVDPEVDSSYERADFERDVGRIQEYIAAGDAFQVVLSQRLSAPLGARPFDLYRALRSVNPSPYLYFLELDGLALVGSSPEALVRVEQRKVTLRPIAGTRPRGRDPEEDERNAAELLADPKERAEHLMLVDLGRNDLGRVAAFGSVRVAELMAVERYSHVLHIVSRLEAELAEGLSAIAVLRACFPAGTVSGAPKVRAMQIIDELEPVRRGPYAGAVGYFSYGGEAMDAAIAIRTLMATGGRAYVQAGAGVVADSVPAAEYVETLAKARALLRVLALLNGKGPKVL